MKFCVSIIVLMLSRVVFAETCTQTENQLNGLVGVDSASGNLVYGSLVSEKNQCGCNFVRFKEQNADTQKSLSVLMAAKLARSTVRVDFQDSEDCNSGWRVYLE
ncbi:hypothetical protein [Microbulbifer hydrolyticus]|uniref:DUF2195 family protein n=1 Tax=Microbulbifer hydrolyticus TaxID=48074 RepID=A0A6P1TDC4_9GAMM|nr:hypothetical protein [Microbulbifer hydrolyticus]MBB5212002.1 hypothetical protein [Microbulbifer hydrolyticus]QHQ39685.1 hypothetical protein GTQ55_12270 [Microbulbifer hydrolyticus]